MRIDEQLTVKSKKDRLLKLTSKGVVNRWIKREEFLKKKFDELEIENQNLKRQNFSEIFIINTIEEHQRNRIDILEICKENRKLRQNHWQIEHFKNLSEQRYQKIKELEEILKNSCPC